MPSRLAGLTKQLTWADFGNPVKRPGPQPGKTAIGAHTATDAPITYGWRSSGKSFQLQDNVMVTIRFLPATSWVADWVFQQPQQFQDDLLNHEQGHYDITALMARDMFIEIMQLKSQTFASKGALDKAVADIVKAYAFQPVHGKYDAPGEANHSMNQTQQKAWDALLTQARTMPRNPPMYAPDGAAYKERLLDVLRRAGKAP
jgi:hypothetical protein